MSWRFNKNGMFSVRSAYHMEWEHQFGNNLRRLDGSDMSRLNPVWDEVWKCKLPSKIKNFAWKCLHSILTCFGSLAHQHVITNSSCPLCARATEDIKHTLFLCEGVKEIRKKMGMWNTIEEACLLDRSGSVVLDFLIQGSFLSPNETMPSNLRELI